jgi:hypothetical protein
MANWTIFHKWVENQHGNTAAKRIDFSAGGDTLKVMLITNTRAPVQATDATMTDIDDNEVSGTNYSAGGATLASNTLTLAAGVLTFDCADITWSQSGSGFSTARYAVLCKSTGTPANDTPVAYANFAADKGNVSGDLVLQMDAAGVWTDTVS